MGTVWAGRMISMESCEVTPKTGRRALTVPNRTTGLGRDLLLFLCKRQADAVPGAPLRRVRAGMEVNCTLKDILNLKANEKPVPGCFYFSMLLLEQTPPYT